MSDDIKERLDTLARLGGGAAVLFDAKSRIEELEAQLAVAREALDLFARHLRGSSLALADGYEIHIRRDDYQRIIKARAALASLPAPGAANVRLEARPADNSQEWTEIFPSQLQWVAKAGHEVRAIEGQAPEAAPTREEIAKPIGFMDAMNMVDRGFDTWKDKPHNAKWYARIDGTPIPNDLKVNIAEAICHYLAIKAAPQRQGE